jgi:hypothetical protein
LKSTFLIRRSVTISWFLSVVALCWHLLVSISCPLGTSYHLWLTVLFSGVSQCWSIVTIAEDGPAWVLSEADGGYFLHRLRALFPMSRVNPVACLLLPFDQLDDGSMFQLPKPSINF